VIVNFAWNWHMDFSMFLGRSFNYVGSIGTALAYLAGIMILCRSPLLERLKDRFAAVGQMALTNYLMQSVLCTCFFYGHGLGMFGKLERFELLYVLLVVWLIQLIASPLWLKYFRYGPAEWAWRGVTYMRWQPMRRLEPEPRRAHS